MRYRTGPKFDARARSRLEGLESTHAEEPTFRGWLLGLLSCAALGLLLPYAEYMIGGSQLSSNLPPAGPLVLFALFILVFNLLLGRWRSWFNLTRQDLALIFCMTMLANIWPTICFMHPVIGNEMDAFFYARPENRYRELIHRYIPSDLAVRDPYKVDPVLACAASDVGGIYTPGPQREKVDVIAKANLGELKLPDRARVRLTGQKDARQTGVYVVVSASQGRLERARDDGAAVQATAPADVGGAFTPADQVKWVDVLSGAASTVDGVKLADQARVLLAGQADPRQNGIYVVLSAASGRLERAPDADGDDKVDWGLYTRVKEGQALAQKGYWLTTAAPIRLNSSPLIFQEFSDDSELPPAANDRFFMGLTGEQTIPWAALLQPFLHWCLALLFVVGMFFTLAALLYPQWGERERLPFPLMQIPENMLAGLFPATNGGSRQKPFLKDNLALIGIGIAFAIQSYNALYDYFPKLDQLPLQTKLDGKYLTEGILKSLQPVWCYIYPSIIGITYLISLEVSFSLWFFYIVVLKLGTLIAITYFGIGQKEWDFHKESGPGVLFIGQGSGALFAMVLVGFYMARRLIWSSLQQALGLAPQDRERDGFSPRTLWTGLALSATGAVGWLVWYGMSWQWAVLAVLVLGLSAVGIARVVSEGGIVFLQMVARPSQMLEAMFSPAALGPQNFTLLRLWSGNFSFFACRNLPTIQFFGSLNLGALCRLRQKPLVLGLAAALVVVLATGFVSYNYVAFTKVGGGRSLQGDSFKGVAATVEKLQGLEKLERESAAKGEEVPKNKFQDVREVNWMFVNWMCVGAGVMLLFVFLRTRIFWWPHPIGYVMWIHPWPLVLMWFSYFIGWLCKALILKFGGQRVYVNARRFFIGLIVGEALAAVLWYVVAWLTDHHSIYRMDVF